MTNEPPDEERAHSESTYDDEEFVEAIRDLGGSATLFAIIEAVGAPFPTTYDRLNRLMLGDEVEYQLEDGSFLWTLADDNDNADTTSGQRMNDDDSTDPCCDDPDWRRYPANVAKMPYRTHMECIGRCRNCGARETEASDDRPRGCIDSYLLDRPGQH